MSAVTTSMETVSPWTMGRNVSVSSSFPIPYCAGRWFRTAILPQDKELETALFHRMNAKKCAVCEALFTPGSNRAKYCPECAARMKRINAARCKRKQREKCHALGAEKPL